MGILQDSRTFWNGWISRVRKIVPQHEENLFLLLAVLIGILSGLAVVCFRRAIDLTRYWCFGAAQHPGVLRLLLVPAAGGLALALLVLYAFPGVRGSGVNQTKSAVFIYDGYISFRTVIGKFITCALAIGSGQSLGPEDPSLQMGAGIASVLGRKIKFSRERMRLIAPVGAAAGLAAAFNAPITAVIFVIEEIIGTWSGGILAGVILAAASSVVVMRLFLGSEPLFHIPEYRMAHPSELLAYAVLGAVGGVASLAFSKLLGSLRGLARAFPAWTQYVQPAVAGLCIGVIALRFPQVMGAGYEYLDQAMVGHFVWHILLALALLKILATSLSFSSGAPGGMFAPTLFVGGMLGAAVGTLQAHFFPAYTGPVGAYALVGMGTLFAGFLRAPMTSVFMVLEISGNYSIIIPVMVSNTIAYLISRRFQKLPIFEVLTKQDGLDLPSMEEHRESLILRVEDAMSPPPPITFSADDSVQTALSRTRGGGGGEGRVLLTHWESGRWTCVRIEDLKTAMRLGKGEEPLRSAVPGVRLPRLHPDQSLDIALRLMRDSEFLPVVHRADPRRLVGMLGLEGILSAYRRAAGSD